MIAPSPLTAGARLAVGALAVLGLAGGWLILLGGGFHHGQRYSRETTFVDGAPAMLMAALCFALAATAVAAFVRSLTPRAGWLLAALAMVLLPPLLWRCSPGC